MTQKEFINHLFNIETKVHYRPICIRTGQAYFNEAFETFLKYDSDWFRHDNIKDIDPYYDNKKLSKFKYELSEHFAKFIILKSESLQSMPSYMMP